MPDLPRLYKQETEYSCGPACLRMVLEPLGVFKTEAELRELSNCTELGTTSAALVAAARSLGLTHTRDCMLTLEELNAQIALRAYPIVVIRVQLSAESLPGEHAAVVVNITGEEVRLLDPWRGECFISISQFRQEWSYSGCRAIVVR